MVPVQPACPVVWVTYTPTATVSIQVPMLETNPPAQMVAKARCRNGRNGETLAEPGEREAAVVTCIRYALQGARFPVPRRKPLPCMYVAATGSTPIQGRAPDAG